MAKFDKDYFSVGARKPVQNGDPAKFSFFELIAKATAKTCIFHAFTPASTNHSELNILNVI